MITNFKMFENEYSNSEINENETKFKIGDSVYIKNDESGVKYKISEIQFWDYAYYKLEGIKNVIFNENDLISQYEIEAKKYNL